MKQEAKRKGKGWSFVDNGKGVVWITKPKKKATAKPTSKAKTKKR